jgi:uncharacterized protein YeaO (DUF488 family)
MTRNKGPNMDLHLKRIYDAAHPDDGLRILVDRLWPRGVSRDAARLDQWLKEVAPTAELRRWFGHDRARWLEFRQRYRAELEGSAAFAELVDLCRHHTCVTLVYGAKDEECNQAVVLRECLVERMSGDDKAKVDSPGP